MNNWGKSLLVATSLTPIFLICAVNSLIRERWLPAGIFLGLFVGLTVLFLFILFVVVRRLPREDFTTQKVKPADKEVLAFLLSYLLPFFNKDSIEFGGELLTAFTIVAVIFMIIYHSSAYTFNPLLASLGYHFYEVESDGMTFLLVSKKPLRKPENTFVVRHLCDYIYIHQG